MDPATLGIGFAIVSTVMLGANKLAVRKSLFRMDESFASFIAIALAIPIFGAPILTYGWGSQPLGWQVVIIFAAAGILNYSVGRYFIWKSIARIGANRANVVASTQVVYAVAIAILVLGQSVNLSEGAGILLVMTGISIIALGELGASSMDWGVRRSGILWGATGALLWGISQVLMQVGIEWYSNATTATFLVSVASLFGIAPVLYFAKRYQKEDPFRIERSSLIMVVIAGLLANFGLYFRFVALQNTTLTVVATVNATNPLFTLVLSYFLIREVEYINARTVLAILISVAGVFLMAL